MFLFFDGMPGFVGFVDLRDGGVCGFVDLWDGGFVDLWDGGVCGMKMNKKSGGGDVRASKSPSEMAYRGLSPCKRKAQPEAQLGDSEAKAMSLERVGCGNSPL